MKTATKNFATSYYVSGYNGTRPYYESQSADEVANEIVNAANGGANDGSNRCGRGYAQGGTFWVIAHSMGGTVMRAGRRPGSALRARRAAASDTSGAIGRGMIANTVDAHSLTIKTDASTRSTELLSRSSQT